MKRAIELLRIGHEKVQTAELAKCASETELKRYRDAVKCEVDIKLQEVEARMKRNASELLAAKQKATAAEKRAISAEALVLRLQNELKIERSMRRGAYLERAAA